MLENQPIILASQSSGRLNMLRNAGVSVEALPAMVDEASLIEALTAQQAKPRDIADQLAEAKATKISRKIPTALVLGADQILVTAQGDILQKASSPDEAEVQLAQLSGTSHRLISAAVIGENGNPVWRIIDTATLTMRDLSAGFIIDYVARNWTQIQHCVGGYQIEGEGAQLFSSITGSQFTIIGLPLLPVLDYLRIRKVLTS
jgi:septum formation protein